MRLRERDVYGIARSAIRWQIDVEISRAIGRPLSEGEGNEIYKLMVDAVEEVLRDFEFEDSEPDPVIDPMQVWADDHKGEQYRRPKGNVIYTVTGEVVKYRHGLIAGVVGIEVRRSSDEKTSTMPIAQLEAMVKINQQEDIK